MLPSFAARIVGALAELESCGEVVVERRPAGSVSGRVEVLGDLDRVFGEIAQQWPVGLADVLRPHYFSAAEYHANWQAADGVVGEFCVRNIRDCLLDGGPPLGDGVLGGGDRGVLSELRLFDEAPFSGEGAVTGLRVRPDGGDVEVWHFVATESLLHRLHLDYGTYLDVLVTTKGAWGWQFLFADVDLSRPRFGGIVENLSAMLEVFPRLFPGHDYAPLRERLRDRL
ncbi:MAG: hypothetical protein ACRD0P_08205 [Stackebrandtia sp.]